MLKVLSLCFFLMLSGFCREPEQVFWACCLCETAGCERQRPQTDREAGVHLCEEARTSHHQGSWYRQRPLLRTLHLYLGQWEEIPQLGSAQHRWYFSHEKNYMRCERWKFDLSKMIMLSLFCHVCHTGTTAKLTLKKTPTEDKTFTLPINIKDNTGMGVTQPFEGELSVYLQTHSTHDCYRGGFGTQTHDAAPHGSKE